MLTTDIAIVGAGPYGLSLAAHLRARSIDFTIIGKPMGSWIDHMPRGMALRSEPFASSLWDPKRDRNLAAYLDSIGAAYRPIGTATPLAQFLDYCNWFIDHEVPAVNERTLVRMRKWSRGFKLSFADGSETSARKVVLATGVVDHRYIPAALRGLPKGLVLHSCEVPDPARLSGSEVLVLGAGQSALETAALLHEAGAKVRLVARTPKIHWNHSSRTSASWWQRVRRPEAGLGIGWVALVFSEMPYLCRYLPDYGQALAGTRWGPRGSDWVRNRLKQQVEIWAGHRLHSAREHSGRVRLRFEAGGTQREWDADIVVSATGYRYDLNNLPFIDPAFRASISDLSGAPVLTRRYESSVPGLYFIGAAAARCFGPAMRFIYGAKHPAACLAKLFSYGTRPVHLTLPPAVDEAAA
jgi:cation diffusion facilitator CzcD-associated flavoprotein CzcO